MSDAPGLDPATGTLLIRGKLANPTRDLLPGVFVRIRLPMERGARNALLVPDRALQEDQGGRYLLVVDKDDVVQQRPVSIGTAVGDLRVITSGLTSEDRVVVTGLQKATPGAKVAPNDEQHRASQSLSLI